MIRNLAGGFESEVAGTPCGAFKARYLFVAVVNRIEARAEAVGYGEQFSDCVDMMFALKAVDVAQTLVDGLKEAWLSGKLFVGVGHCRGNIVELYRSALEPVGQLVAEKRRQAPGRRRGGVDKGYCAPFAVVAAVEGGKEFAHRLFQRVDVGHYLALALEFFLFAGAEAQLVDLAELKAHELFVGAAALELGAGCLQRSHRQPQRIEQLAVGRQTRAVAGYGVDDGELERCLRQKLVMVLGMDVDKMARHLFEMDERYRRIVDEGA